MLKNKEKMRVTFSDELTQVHTVDTYKQDNKAHSQTQFEQDLARFEAKKEKPAAVAPLKPTFVDIFSKPIPPMKNDLNLAGSKLFQKRKAARARRKAELAAQESKQTQISTVKPS